MKITRSFRIEKLISETLDANCHRHGDITFHVENALTAYFSKIPEVQKVVPVIVFDKQAQDWSSADSVIDYLNLKAGTRYKNTKGNRDKVSARLTDFTVQDCFIVIDKKCKEWLGTNFAKFLRPATLFQLDKLEGYLNQLDGVSNETNKPKSLAERSADQTAIIQSKLAAGEFDNCPMGPDDSALPQQVDFGRGREASEQRVHGQFYPMVPENGAFDR